MRLGSSFAGLKSDPWFEGFDWVAFLIIELF
jgi:hypothetical protein